ncbi:MAG: DUF4169 family protein [Alphaproteobacteria bacterium]|nr:DUF4169 family protein [Alphaproteobacteria bacterium]
MAEIVSLNQYRKARKRAKAASEASGNRVRHGRTKSEKQCDAAERDLQANTQDGKRLEHKDGPPDTD